MAEKIEAPSGRAQDDWLVSWKAPIYIAALVVGMVVSGWLGWASNWTGLAFWYGGITITFVMYLTRREAGAS